MTDLEAKKRALIAESEVYRQMLTVDVHNLRIYNAHFQRKLKVLRSFRALVFLLPLLAPLGFRFARAGRRETHTRGGWRGLVGTGLFAWRLYRKFNPLLRSLASNGFFSRFTEAKRKAESTYPNNT